MNTSPTTWNHPALRSFNPKEWRYHGYWKQELFAAYFWHSCFDKARIEKLGISISEIGYLMFKEGHYVASQKVYDQILEQATASLATGDLSVWEALQQDSKTTHQEITQLLQTPIDELTAQNWEQALRLAQNDTLYWGIVAAYLCPIADQLLQEAVIKEGLDLTILPQIIPTLDTPLMHQRKELEEIRKIFKTKQLPITMESVNQDAELKHLINNHLARYSWIEFASWVGSPLTHERLLALVTSFEDTSETKQDISQFSDQLKNALKLFEIAGFIRQACGEYFMQLSFHYREALEKYAQHLGMSYKDLLKLSPEELLEALEGEVSPDQLKERIKVRSNGDWITFTQDGKGLIIEDSSDTQTMVALMVPTANTEATEIKGQVGNRGSARGIVRIVMNTEEFGTFKPGEVLVSSMTTPDFVVLMQQAAAIVTDQGGLLCHAAIVSREMNKPCVIGTKVGTKVLKNGDLVEVDANNGIVRRISR